MPHVRRGCYRWQPTSSNFGLRSYYFGMAMLTWFISPWLFMVMSVGVVLVLYRREFHSDVLDVMVFTPTESAPTEVPKESSSSIN